MTRRQPRVRTVVITGASSGLGRATALEFARRGWNVALIARGARSLQAAAAEVEAAGGRSLALPLDVADAKAVETAADRVVREFGAIDVWINGAAVAEYAPLHEMTADEFKRITEVTYLGSVYGIRAALKHMRPRDRGQIIQIGSVVSQRALPLQSAYSGAKYGIRGVLDALNAELRHERSRIRTTIVQPPGLNTPFFEHARNKMAHRPMPTPPVYEPEVAARAIWRATTGKPRELWVGGVTTAGAVGHVLAPGLTDRFLGRVGYQGQQTTERRSVMDPDNLFRSLDDGGRVHGRFGQQALADGQAVEPFRVRMLLGVAGVAGIAAVTALAMRSRSGRDEAQGDVAVGGNRAQSRTTGRSPTHDWGPQRTGGLRRTGAAGGARGTAHRSPSAAGTAGTDTAGSPRPAQDAVERSVERAFRNTSPDLPGEQRR